MRDILGRGGYNTTIYDLGVDLHIKTSFNCVLSLLYTWTILVPFKKLDFRAKYDPIDSAFFANSTNLPHKTLETDESEAKEVEKKSSEFVEFVFIFQP